MVNVDRKRIKKNREYFLELGKSYHEKCQDSDNVWNIYDILIDKFNNNEIIVCGYYLNPQYPFLEYMYVLFDENLKKTYTINESSAKIYYFKPDDKLLPDKIANNINIIDKIQKNIYNINDKIKFVGGN